MFSTVSKQLVALRSSLNDNQSVYRISEHQLPGTCWFLGAFYMWKRASGILLTFLNFFDTISSCRPLIGINLWEVFSHMKFKEGLTDE